MDHIAMVKIQLNMSQSIWGKRATFVTSVKMLWNGNTWTAFYFQMSFLRRQTNDVRTRPWFPYSFQRHRSKQPIAHRETQCIADKTSSSRSFPNPAESTLKHRIMSQIIHNVNWQKQVKDFVLLYNGYRKRASKKQDYCLALWQIPHS